MTQLRPLWFMLVVAAALVLPTAAAAAAPANDAFASAQELTGRVVTVDGLNKDATKEAGEPNHAGDPGGASVWYRWTAPADGDAVVSTCGSSFDTLLGVYTGTSVAALTEVAANDDTCGLQSAASFTAAAGVEYRIAVDGLAAETGLIALNVRLAPANDDFSQAHALAGNAGSIAGTNIGASREAGEPEYLFSSVWYSWTAPSSGVATFETCGGDFESVLAAFTGDQVTSLASVDARYGWCGFAARLSFAATEGTTYRIAVDGYGEGDFVLSWSRNPLPPEPPYSDESPVIAGAVREGETLTVSDGTWFGTPPFSFAYAWDRCTPTGGCTFVPGAVSRTYTLTIADIGYHMRARVTATNGGGTEQGYSGWTGPVRARGPFNTAAPQLTGIARVGEALIASDGIWTGQLPMQFAIQWQVCDLNGSGCADLQGERSGVLELRSVHLGKRIRVVVTASNVDGSRSAASETSATVAGAIVPQVRCVVPNVRGKTIAQARRILAGRHCALGRRTRAYSAKVKPGRIIRQSRRPGARLARNTRVNVVVSRGKRR